MLRVVVEVVEVTSTSVLVARTPATVLDPWSAMLLPSNFAVPPLSDAVFDTSFLYLYLYRTEPVRIFPSDELC